MRQRATKYSRFWTSLQGRATSISIESVTGQAHFLLLCFAKQFEKSPGEWLLLCRYASTIGAGDGNYEFQNLERLAIHLTKQWFELRTGYVHPAVARAVEREIIAQTAPEFAEGYDMTPALRMLAQYEAAKPVFTQPERNLILHHAFCTGSRSRMEEIAEMLVAKALTRQRVIEVCTEIEEAHLNWIGRDTLDGIELSETSKPGTGLDLWNCDSPYKQYLPFALYPTGNIPDNASVLKNGTVLFPCSSEDGWWRSGFRKVDQTFTVPRHYKSAELDMGRFEIAEAEYRSMYPRQEQQESAPGLRMSGL